MKNRSQIKKAFLFACFCIAFFSSIQAQNALLVGTAIMNDKGKMVLENKGELTYNNVLDISTMKFENNDKTSEHFTKKNTELVTFDVDLERKTVNIQIELRARPNWNIEDWNKYLEKL